MTVTRLSLVELQEFWCKAMGRLEEGQLDGDPEVDHAVAKDGECAPVVEFGCQALGKATLRGVGVVAVATEK